MNLEDHIGDQVWSNKAYKYYDLVDVIEGKSGDKYALVKNGNDEIKIIEADNIGGYWNRFSEEFRSIGG